MASARVKIEREAHSLKSGAATFGYRELAGLAQRLERAAAEISEQEFRKLLGEIDIAYATALAQKELS